MCGRAGLVTQVSVSAGIGLHLILFKRNRALRLTQNNIFAMRGAVMLVGLALTRTVMPSEVIGTSHGVCRSKLSLSLFEQPVCHEPHLVATTNSPQGPGGSSQDRKWEGPEHCLAGFCIYWAVRSDIVLVTNQKNAETVMGMVSHAQEVPQTPDADNKEDMYHEVDVPGKGIGLIANRPIRKGERIMARQPSLLVQVASQARISVQLRDHLYSNALKKLGDQAHRRLLGMVGRDLGDKIDKNCFRLRIGAGETGDGGDHHIACYPDVARLNHDCRPR